MFSRWLEAPIEHYEMRDPFNVFSGPDLKWSHLPFPSSLPLPNTKRREGTFSSVLSHIEYPAYVVGEPASSQARTKNYRARKEQ